MSANISALDRLLPEAIKHFWKARAQAASKQVRRGSSDQGGRSGVTAGKNLDGFVRLVRQIIIDNGILDPEVFIESRSEVTIPGFYRPTKNWDLVVVSRGRLLAAIEFKSQVGPSFGNNFNNRVEESLGNATDLLRAYKEGAFGDSPRPFLGYFFILEECTKSLTPVRFISPHFDALPEFKNTSYAARYDLLCRKLVREQLYDAAALVLAKKSDARTGKYRPIQTSTGPKRFAATLAGRMSAMGAE